MITITQTDNQTINISNRNIQEILINENENQNIKINNESPQDINLKQKENQTILINGGGLAYAITDVLVNGVSVVTDNIAYIIVPTKTSELINNSGFISNETDPTVPYYIKAITLADINNWNNKQNELISGTTIKTINNTSILGSGNINIEGTVYSAGTGININNSNVISNTIVSYNDLEDLPEIPTKTSDLTNDSDYVTENELSDVAFSGSYTDLSNIPVIPDSTSELVNDSGFIDKNVNDLTYYTPTANLGAVALSNSYNDLDNKPTIPTVNDGTLTIQQNGTTLDTFSANTSSNKTVNVTVPTKTSDLTNDSGFITNNYDVYSTTETRVGTWIDDKPVYRQVINFTISSTWQTIANIPNIKNIINIKATSTNGYTFPYYRDTNNFMSFYYSTSSKNLICDSGSSENGKNVYCIIEYTKTTD